MKNLLLISALIWAGITHAQPYTPVDASSSISFKIKNFGSTVDGRFSGLSGSIFFDESNVSAASFQVTVESKTIDTGIGLRDSHLRKKDYFAVSEHATIRFASSSVTLAKPGSGTVTGRLTIKKTTKEISVPFTYVLSGNTIRFKGEFALNRRDFGVGGGSISLADEVKVFLEVTAIRSEQRG